MLKGTLVKVCVFCKILFRLICHVVLVNAKAPIICEPCYNGASLFLKSKSKSQSQLDFYFLSTSTPPISTHSKYPMKELIFVHNILVTESSNQCQNYVPILNFHNSIFLQNLLLDIIKASFRKIE